MKGKLNMKTKDNKVEKKFIKLMAHFKSIDSEELMVRGVVGSDDSLDRHGDRVNPKGWDLTNYKKNPIILLNHNYEDLPIAKAVNVKRKDNKLVFDIQFSKSYEKAVTAFNLIKEKILNAWSVGFIVLEWGNEGGDYTIEKQELLELSLVTVPANPNALTESQKLMIKQLEVVKKEEKEEKEEEKEDATRGESDEKAGEESKDKDDKVDSEKEEEKDENGDDTDQKDDDELKKLSLKVEELETKIKEIETNFEKAIDAKIAKLVDYGDLKSDEENANDESLLVLNALRAELKDKDKDIGKTLSEINKLLKNR